MLLETLAELVIVDFEERYPNGQPLACREIQNLSILCEQTGSVVNVP